VKLMPIRPDGLQLEEPREFQKRFWIAERIAWIIFALIIMLALLGFTGAGGPFSRTSVEIAGASLDYPRVSRWQTSDELRVTLPPGNEERRLTFAPAFYESFQVEGIEPQPESQISTAKGIEMTFAADADAPALIVIYVRPLHPGFPSFAVGLNGNDQRISSVILP
jgi:hypothetical protein